MGCQQVAQYIQFSNAVTVDYHVCGFFCVQYNERWAFHDSVQTAGRMDSVKWARR